MKYFIFCVVSVVALSGCARLKNVKGLDSAVFGGLSDTVCSVSCENQDIADKVVCANICSTAAELGKNFACGDSKELVTDGVVDLSCAALCSAQQYVAASVCTPVCKFLAKTAETTAKSCLL